jgi:KDO2-lipid IV(A) lauroyltransferase
MADGEVQQTGAAPVIDDDIIERVTALKPSVLGSLIFALFPLRRRVVMENLRLVFGDRLSEDQVRQLARCAYGHFARTIIETFGMIVSSERRIAAKVDVLGVEHVLRAAEDGKGVLLLAGHFGNWELAAVAAMLQFKQYRNRFHVIRKSLGLGLENLVFTRFRKAGLQIINPSNALESVFDALENNDVVIFIMDQYQVPGSKAMAVEFFGMPTGTNRSLALVARQSGAPVVPASSHRRPDGRHVIRFHRALEWLVMDSSREEIYRNTLAYNRVLEQFVLEHPEQWLWAHRRWKSHLRPPTRRRQRELDRGWR